MRQIEHRLRNIEARAAATAVKEPIRIIRQIVDLTPDGHWAIVSEIDRATGTEVLIPPEKQVRIGRAIIETNNENSRASN
jgi:hypothetical protein